MSSESQITSYTQSSANYITKGIANAAETRTGPWWEMFEAAKAYFAENNMWPVRSHPTLGRWVDSVNTAMRRLANQQHNWQGAGKFALTSDRLSALRQAKYEPHARGSRGFKPGPVQDMLKKLEAGETLSPQEKSFLRGKYNKGQMGEKTYEAFKKLGMEF